MFPRAYWAYLYAFCKQKLSLYDEMYNEFDKHELTMWVNGWPNSFELITKHCLRLNKVNRLQTIQNIKNFITIWYLTIT